MKARVQEVLQYLTTQKGYTTIEELAQKTQAGVRTIHRDIDVLSRSLGFRGIRLERRRGYGVRLLDPLPPHLIEEISQFPQDEIGDISLRPSKILLYLILHMDWVKLSEISSVLHVSDSSVSSDLTSLEQQLPKSVEIQRQKGVGVRVQCSEFTARMVMIHCLPAVLPPFSFSPLTDSGEKNDWFLQQLSITTYSQKVILALQQAQEALGVDIAPRYVSLLGGYLLFVACRKDQKRLLLELPKFSLGLPELYRKAADTMLSGICSDCYPPEEKELLARILGASETATPPVSKINELIVDLLPVVQEIIERTLGKIEEQQKIWLHDDQDLIEYLKITIVAAIRRLNLFSLDFTLTLPSPVLDYSSDSVAPTLCGIFLEAAGGLVPVQSTIVLQRELEEAILALDARLEKHRSRKGTGYSVRVLCYEGLGMSTYIKTLAQDVLPPGTTIDYHWDAHLPQSLDNVAKYDLIISTYKLPALPVPVILIHDEWSANTIRQAIGDSFQSRVLTNEKPESPANFHPNSKELGISLSAIMEVVQNFSVCTLETGQDPFALVLKEFAAVIRNEQQVIQDLERRESYGSLVFEEYNIRLIHCRTDGIIRPRSGVFQLPPAKNHQTSPTILAILAPKTLPTRESRVLSEIVVALSEDSELPRLFQLGNKETIQQKLMDYFSQLIERI